MPKLPIDYSKSCVYRLIHNHENYYVGSTTNFVKRKAEHKSNSNNEKDKKYNLPIYKFIRETGGWIDNDWDMILIESYPECKTSEELRKYERFHYDVIRPKLNVSRPHRTEDERKEYFTPLHI
jgi:GIY-YIG catalytic domain